MLKKLITTAAGLLLTGQMAFAQPTSPFGPAPTQGSYSPAPAPQQQGLMFRGQSKGQVITIELFGQDQTVGGVITFGSQTFPFAARIEGNVISGNFEVGGNRYPFRARVQGSDMSFVSDGNEIHLSRVTSGPAVNDPQPAYVPQQPAYVPQQPAYVPQQPAYVPQQPTEPARGTSSIEQVTGKAWQYLMPTGWHANESETAVLISSPDAMIGYGSVIHPNTSANTPEDIVRTFISDLGATNVNVLSQRPGTMQGGDATLEVEFTYTSAQGQNRHVWLGVGLMRGQTQSMGMLTYAGTPVELWESKGKALITLATKSMLRQAAPAPTQNRGGQLAGVGY